MNRNPESMSGVAENRRAALNPTKLGGVVGLDALDPRTGGILALARGTR